MANFYATYAPSAPSAGAVSATQGTSPWIVAGGGTAGTAATGVVTIQGIASGVAVPVSGSFTDPAEGTPGSPAPASAIQVGGTDGTNLRVVKVSSTGLVSTDGSAVTQPVSGTVTANIGTSGSLALDATVAQLNVAQGATLGANTGPLLQGSVTTAAPSYTTGKIDPLSLTVAGALRTDASATTQPVSGTVSATQSGTWTVQPGNTANTTPWLVTGSGTAGTAATGVVTVQGIASGVAQPISGSVSGTGTFTTDQVATTAATFQSGSIAFGSLTTSYATVLTTGGVVKSFQIANSTGAIVLVSLNGGSTDSYVLDGGTQVSVDLKPLGLSVAASTVWQAKYTGTAPAVGGIRITAVY